EVFFVLQGFLDVFVEDESGRRITTRLGPWECISCPAGVIHGYQNDSLEPVYFQVMLGRGRPETMGYADEELFKRRAAHLTGTQGRSPHERSDMRGCVGRGKFPDIAPLIRATILRLRRITMSKLRLTFACGPYDRTAALRDGSLSPEGIDL